MIPKIFGFKRVRSLKYKKYSPIFFWFSFSGILAINKSSFHYNLSTILFHDVGKTKAAFWKGNYI